MEGKSCKNVTARKNKSEKSFKWSKIYCVPIRKVEKASGKLSHKLDGKFSAFLTIQGEMLPLDTFSINKKWICEGKK